MYVIEHFECTCVNQNFNTSVIKTNTAPFTRYCPKFELRLTTAVPAATT